MEGFMMQYKDFRGEVSLSRLGMGTMRLPREGNQPGAPIDFAKSETIIDKAMAVSYTHLMCIRDRYWGITAAGNLRWPSI